MCGPTAASGLCPRLVDVAILGRPAGLPLLAGRAAELAAAASRRNRLYRLFLAEFSAALRGDRDEDLRRDLAAALGATRYDDPKSVAALRRRLVDLLRAHPEDLRAVRDAVARAYAAPDPGAAAQAALAATAFGFDRRTLARLRALPGQGETAAALRALLAGRVAAGPPPAEPPANLYAAAPEGSRLVVPADRLADFYDILAADVRDPGKAGLLSAVAAGVFEPLDFIRRPGEHLSVRVGD